MTDDRDFSPDDLTADADAANAEEFEPQEPDLEKAAEAVTQTVDLGQRDETITEPAEFGETERLRQPRAQGFRRRLQNQVGMLPLAFYLLALGGYLLARERNLPDLPDFSSVELAGMSVLALAFTAVFHALLSGRRERGLLFLGLWVWVTAGAVTLLITSTDGPLDAAEWWPLGLATLGVTLFLTFIIERTHDARLVLLGVMMLVAAGTAYWITSGQIAEQYLSDATDYWPLLLSVIGIGLLPLAFRRSG